jgi:hypothetical protein
MSRKKLEAKWTVETEKTLWDMHYGDWMRHALDIEFNYVPRVYWWQAWRWHLLFNDDYILCKATGIALSRAMAMAQETESLEAIIDRHTPPEPPDIQRMREEYKPEPLTDDDE